MVRIVIFVIAILGIFVGTLAYGGDRLGSWDGADPPPPSNLQPITRPEENKKNNQSKQEGGSAAPAATTQLAPDRLRWIRQTNALCRRVRAETEETEEPATLGEAERLLLELQGKNRDYNDAFARIAPAKGDERQVAKLLALFDRDERLVAALIAAMRKGDAGALLELNERLQSVAAQEEDILVGLGATECSLGLLGTTY